MMSAYNPDSQLIDLPLINCRELGGMPLRDGHVFRSGLFLRSGAPSELKTREEFEQVKAYGVKNVIDFRGITELERCGNPFRDDADTNFYSIPLFIGDPGDVNNDTMQFLRTHHLGDYYVIIMEQLGDKVAQVLRILLNAEGLTLYHCAHGKDRTGVISAILYLIAGADREDIVTNYKVSYDYLEDFLKPLIDAAPDDMKHTLRSDEINIRIFLKYLDDKWDGKVENYLISNGMSESEIKALRDKCVE
jgi:protein-tyrosine phosphatase